MNWIEGRGKLVVCEAIINEEVTKKENKIKEEFPNKTLMAVNIKDVDYPWSVDMENFKAMR